MSIDLDGLHDVLAVDTITLAKAAEEVTQDTEEMRVETTRTMKATTRNDEQILTSGTEEEAAGLQRSAKYTRQQETGTRVGEDGDNGRGTQI